jgi:hypothetical protein
VCAEHLLCTNSGLQKYRRTPTNSLGAGRDGNLQEHFRTSA